MKDSRIKLLITTVKKLLRRGAKENIQKVLAKSHTADIAEIIENLNTGENIEVYRLEQSLEKRAEVLSYLKQSTQEELLYMMEDNEAEAIVSRMDNDDAADLLGSLPEELSTKILTMMEREDSEEVVDLMAYDEDTAGGIMNSDFLSLNKDLKAAEAIIKIQKKHDELSVLFYVYVINSEEKLVGVLSLKQLLLANPTETLDEIILSDVISVLPETDQEEVAKIVERYDFLAIPVVDQEMKLLGVITVDDVIDVIREEVEEDLLAMGRAGWSADVSVWEHIKARIPWLFLTAIGGLIAGYIILIFTPVSIKENVANSNYWRSIVMLPLLLSLGVTAGGQAVTIALGVLRKDGVSQARAFSHLFKEIRIVVPIGGIFFVLLYLFSFFFLKYNNYSLFIGGIVALQLILSVLLGSLVPFLVKKMGLELSTASTPLYAVLADIMSVLLLFAGYQYIYK